MHISLDGFVADPNGEMNWTNINYEFRMMNYEFCTLRNIHNS